MSYSSVFIIVDALEEFDNNDGSRTRFLDHLFSGETGWDELMKPAEILGTEILDNDKGTMSNCGMVNVRLPLKIEPNDQETDKARTVSFKEASALCSWGVDLVDADTRLQDLHPGFVVQGRWWARLSTQVYLGEDDFEWVGRTLVEVCQRVEKREYRTDDS